MHKISFFILCARGGLRPPLDSPDPRGFAPWESPRRVFDPFETHTGTPLQGGLREGVTARIRSRRDAGESTAWLSLWESWLSEAKTERVALHNCLVGFIAAQPSQSPKGDSSPKGGAKARPDEVERHTKRHAASDCYPLHPFDTLRAPIRHPHPVPCAILSPQRRRCR